tara:strand:- start:1401 stop:2555 length:1155 start_codon:yes stop_codon:yes gene_type:complete
MGAMYDSYQRKLSISLPKGKSAFLWGPRQVGKTHWIKHHLNDIIYIDFLKTDIFADYASKPSLLRERFAQTNKTIVIDEIQMVPQILNEVHWLIENKQISFLLTGSSPKKLRETQANLLGGRAWRFTMTPLCYPEIPDYDIQRAVIHGLLPAHYSSDTPKEDLRGYVASYLKEEIASWANTTDLPIFSEFLHVAALTNGELLNYTNVARESGVSSKTVRQYFQVLEDTLLGFRLSPWRKTRNRRLIETDKFYLFDVGVANYLAKRQPLVGSSEFGKSFEHIILMELFAYKAYQNPELALSYWRTSTGQEVDFIIGDMDIALEIKSSKRVHESDTKALSIVKQEYSAKRCIIISFEDEPKTFDNGIEHLPWKMFLQQLWDGTLFS